MSAYVDGKKWHRRTFSTIKPGAHMITMTAENCIYVAPIGRPRLRFRIAAWLRKLDRRDPWHKWRTMGLLDDTREAPGIHKTH